VLCSDARVSGEEPFAVAKGKGPAHSRAASAAQHGFLLLGVFGVLGALPAAAQQQRDESAPEREQGLRIQPSVEVAYDDNVYRVDSDTEDPVDDVIVTPMVELLYDRDVGPRAFSLRGLLGYERFLSEGERSKPRLELEGSARFLIAGTCSVRPHASYRQRRADYGDINSRTENLQRFSTLELAADCERPGLYPVAAFRRDTTRNDDAFDYADQTSTLYRGGIGYNKPSLGTLTAYFEHLESERPGLGVENRYDAYGLSFARSVSPLTSIDADLRWMHVTSSSAAVGSYDGPGWMLRITNTAIPRVRLAVSTERGIVNDSLIATGFAIRTAHRISADVGLSELTSIGAFADFARREFRHDAAIRPFNYTRDRTNQFGLLARRKFTDRFEADLSVSRIDRATNGDVSNYRATRVALGATMRF